MAIVKYLDAFIDGFTRTAAVPSAADRIKAYMNGGEKYVGLGLWSRQNVLDWAFNIGAIVLVSERFGPSYHPVPDKITMPHELAGVYASHTFETALLHELAHWSGHCTRLNRPLFKESYVLLEEIPPNCLYADEEIIAELTAATLAQDLGVGWGAALSGTYIKHWRARTDKTIDDLLPKAIEAAEYLKERAK